MAMFVLIISHSIAVTPSVKERGWIAAPPTWSLVLLMPFLRPDISCYDWPLTTAKGVREQLFDELLERFEDRPITWNSVPLLRTMCYLQNPKEYGSFEDWPTLNDMIQGTIPWAKGRTLEWWPSIKPLNQQLTIKTRDDWQGSKSVWAKVEMPGRTDYNRRDIRVDGVPQRNIRNGCAWSEIFYAPLMCGTGLPPSPWDDGLVRIGSAGSTETLRFDCSIRGEQSALPTFCTRYLPVANVALAAELISCPRPVPVKSPQLDQWLRETLKPVLTHGRLFRVPDPVHYFFFDELGEEPDMGLGENFRDPGSYFAHVTIAFHAEIILQNQVIGVACAWFRWHDGSLRPYGRCIIVEKVNEKAPGASDGNGDLRLRLKSDREFALRDFDCTHYWEGELEVPLIMNLQARPGW